MIHVQLRHLPGDPSRLRIHYYAEDPAGPVKMPSGSIMSSIGPVAVGGSRGRIACQGMLKSVLPRVDGGGVTHLVPHTNEPRAVTCPECRLTKVFQETMAIIAELDGNQNADVMALGAQGDSFAAAAGGLTASIIQSLGCPEEVVADHEAFKEWLENFTARALAEAKAKARPK